MNRHINLRNSAMAAWLATAFVAGLPAAAAPAAAPVAPPVAHPAAPETVSRSVFVVPTNSREGRDPFFPDSTRLFDDTPTSTVPEVGNLSSLILKGISGPPGHRLAIINNHTFGPGDEGDVTTSHGRIHIRCLEIKADQVVVESGRQHQVLTYGSGP